MSCLSFYLGYMENRRKQTRRCYSLHLSPLDALSALSTNTKQSQKYSRCVMVYFSQPLHDLTTCVITIAVWKLLVHWVMESIANTVVGSHRTTISSLRSSATGKLSKFFLEKLPGVSGLIIHLSSITCKYLTYIKLSKCIFLAAGWKPWLVG